MFEPDGFLRRHAVRIAALAAILSLYGFTRLPHLDGAEEAALAAQFRFTRHALPEPPGERRGIRRVHPELEHIAAWISSVGASVALHDLDGDGLANDACWVDNATDRVVVAPVPETGDRYPAFTLDPAPLPWDATMAPMGCLPGDLNEDGLADLLVYYWGRPPVAFLHRGGGAPEALAGGRYRPLEVAEDPSQRWYTNAATRADVDGDGHPDLVIGNYFQDGSRILDPEAGDRQHMHHSMSRADNAGRNRLLLWVAGRGGGDGGEPEARYREVEGALPERAEIGWTLAVGAADLDGDLLPELYFANDFGPDRLLHNRSRPGAPLLVPVGGRETLTTPSSKVLGKDSFKGMGVDFGDLNGDGVPDIYVSNIADEYALEESHFLWLSTGDGEAARAALAAGRAPYRDASEPLGLSRSGWGWESRLADFNNDGVLEAVQATGFVKGSVNRWPELHEVAMGNDELLRHPRSWPRVAAGDDLSGHLPNPFFARSASGRYFDLAPRLGIDDPMVTRAIATADVDGDGDLDFAVGNQWERSYVYRNENPTGAGSLILDLLLPLPGGGAMPAVGAAATVTLPDGRRLIAQVDGGNGHSGARSPEVHFGLGRSAERVAVEVAWRGRDGVPRRRALRLAPGRHRLVLEKEEGRAGSSDLMFYFDALEGKVW